MSYGSQAYCGAHPQVNNPRRGLWITRTDSTLTVVKTTTPYRG